MITEVLRQQAEAAVRAYRQDGHNRHLGFLEREGFSQIVLALSMERVWNYDQNRIRKYTEEVDEWLNRGR